jgi:non-ribosomal peptide synthetase-like protein
LSGLSPQPKKLLYVLENTMSISALETKIIADIEYLNEQEHTDTIILRWIIAQEDGNDAYKIIIQPLKNGIYEIYFTSQPTSFYDLAFKNARQHLQIILKSCIETKERSIEDLSYLAETETQELRKFNEGETNETIKKPGLLHQLFEQSVQRYPTHCAIAFGALRYSYQEVNEKAAFLAELLIRRNVKPGDFVGILLKRSPEVYLSMLAVLKAGAAYVPLDVNYPEDRIRYILDDCNVKLLLTHSNDFHKITDNRFPVLIVDELFHQSIDITDEKILPNKLIHPDLPAYVIYTSGSTGWPKGVVISHASACHLGRAEQHVFNLDTSEKVAQGFSVAFDASVEEIWLAFASGSTLFPVSEDTMRSGSSLEEFIATNGITVLSTVPTMLSMMQGPLPSLKLLILGGEYCSLELLERWKTNSLRVVNTYGPTEATVIATFIDFNIGQKNTIGKPIHNYSTYVVDDTLSPVALGIPGELCIGGCGLATEYLNRKELTTEKFIVPRFKIKDGDPKRIYRTGDLVRYNEEGNLEFLGRIDLQVKLRGYRIELSEIESQLISLPQVKNAVVVIREDNYNVQQLIAYVILTKTDSSFDEASVKDILKQKLAWYMIPSLFVILEQFPILPSGKTDRKKMPEPQFSTQQNRVVQSAKNNAEKLILRSWQKYFPPQSIGVTDDFFELGGHSLLAALVISDMRKDKRLSKFSIQDIYTFKTIEKLAEKLENEHVSPTVNTYKEKILPPVSKFTYLFTSSIQLLSFLFFFLVGSLGLLTPLLLDRFETTFNPYHIAVLTTLSIFISIPVVFVLSIVAKWLLIGRYKTGTYPLWGWYYLRFWIVKKFTDFAPLGLISGTPFISIYYRLMGAKIGTGVYLGTDRLRIFDQTFIGKNSSISKEVNILGYTVDNGQLIIGTIHIGDDCFIGPRSSVGINSSLKNEASLGELSLLPPYSSIPEKESWQGSPAEKEQTTVQEEKTVIAGGKQLWFPFYLLVQALAILFILICPLVILIPFVLVFHALYIHLGFASALLSLVPSSIAYITSFCLFIAALKWIITGRVKEEEFSIYSFKYIQKWSTDMLMNMNLLYFRSMYATIYLPSWLRLMGCKVGKGVEVSTVNQLDADLLSIGANSFLADSVSIGSPEVRYKRMKTRKITIGTKTFIGNSAVISSGSSIGNEMLIGVLSVPPIDKKESMKDGTSWLGSPSMFLPQRQASEKFPDRLTFHPSLSLYIQRGTVEFFKITLPYIISAALISTFYVYLAPLLHQKNLIHIFWKAPLILLLLFLTTPLITVAVKKILIGKYKKINKPLWSFFVWNNELVNSLCESMVYPFLVNMTLGTPFAPIFFRMMGCKIGKQVYMETTEITEFDLVHIGDYVCLNHLSTIQTHLFEDRVMKMDHLKVGNRCTIGSMSVILYGSEMEDDSSLDSLSLVMKGEVIPTHTRWAGSTARFVEEI